MRRRPNAWPSECPSSSRQESSQAGSRCSCARSRGAGAEMRFTLGLAVFSGMLGVTIFGIFFTPIFYYVIRWFTKR
mgnify:CR=1 FL=1